MTEPNNTNTTELSAQSVTSTTTTTAIATTINNPTTTTTTTAAAATATFSPGSAFTLINSNPLLNSVEDNDLLVKSIAEGYSHYLGFSQSTNDQAKNIDDTIEYMLARLDEFGAFVETIKTDTDKTDSKLIPLLFEKTKEVQQLFPIIDKLTELSSDINKNISTLEDRLNQADKHVSNLTGKSNPLKWVLSHIQKEEDILQQIKNSQDSNNNTQLKFEPLKIHNTAEFFKQVRSQAQPSIANPNITQNETVKTE
ncbi:hypothetical protein RB653_005571 [Dictyostelium firmibasis]|uniref:Uncharacterized protein n=1 Tax=Dictyostelium firmibasis TaxID=79012 RepID=A0AAN7UCV8_9MYCE